MGRQARRVPLDFDWPIRKTWDGYLMPDRLAEDNCTLCDGDGYTREARAIADTFYPHMISWADRETSERLAWCDKLGQAEVDNLIKQGRLKTWRDSAWHKDPRTAADVNDQQRRGGPDIHDAINRMILVEFRCERLGIPLSCPRCEGHGTVEKYSGQRAEAEAWEPTDPPTGEGWQMWETTSEGSPISPVFASADELAEWCAEHATIFGESSAPVEQWRRLIGGDVMAGTVTVAPGVVVM